MDPVLREFQGQPQPILGNRVLGWEEGDLSRTLLAVEGPRRAQTDPTKECVITGLREHLISL